MKPLRRYQLQGAATTPGGQCVTGAHEVGADTTAGAARQKLWPQRMEFSGNRKKYLSSSFILCLCFFPGTYIYILQFEVCTLWYILLPVPFLSFQFLLLGNRYAVILIVLLREIRSFGFRKKHGMSNNLTQKEHIWKVKRSNLPVRRVLNYYKNNKHYIIHTSQSMGTT